MDFWIVLVLIYGVFKGVREIIKKKALEESSLMEVLFFYTLIGFICVIPSAKSALEVDISIIGYILIKSFIIFLAWILGFIAIKQISVSLYSVLDLSMVLFSTTFGVLILGEVLTRNRIFGLIFVLIGLLLVNLKGRDQTEKTHVKYIIFVLMSSFLNAASSLMDKILMTKVSSGQLQFWFMLLMTVMYLLYIIITKIKINWRTLIRNYWVWILGILSFLADRALFMANAYPDSKLTVMTLLKQCSVLIAIIGGKVIYKEKNIRYKLCCAGIVILGIAVALL